MGYPINYRRERERVIQTFNFVDIASGEGYSDFFGFADSEDTTIVDAATISMTSIQVKAAVVTTIANNGFDGVSISFQTSGFNLPRTLKGIAYVYFATLHKTTGAGGTRTYKVKAEIFKNTTSLGSKTSDVIAEIGAGSTAVGIGLLAIDLTETIIKKGDTLKVTLTLVVTGQIGGDGMKFVFDPQDRDLAADGGYPTMTAAEQSTQLKVSLPFKIDI